MPKISLDSILSGFSTGKINANFAKIAKAINENLLSRRPDGQPNAMLAPLDMNSNDVLNLPYPVYPTSPVRLQDLLALNTNPGTNNPGSNRITILDFGAVGDGVADDTAAFASAYLSVKHLIVPAGLKLLITGSVTVPPHCTLEFEGGLGNTLGQLPSSYIVKHSSVNGPAVILRECSQFIGGGILGITGNTGPGIAIWGNSVFVDRPYIARCGDYGIRVGKDDSYQNCNSPLLNKPICSNNGLDGIYVHDGYSNNVPADSPFAGRADANAGTMIHPFCYQNGRDGINIDRGWWWTVVGPLTEGNGRRGMNCSDDVGPNDTVANCRYINIIGGDFNEGNGESSLWFKGYAGNLFMSTANQEIKTGGVLNNVYGGGGENINWGQTINRFLTVNDLPANGITYPSTVTKPLSGTPGEGAGIAFQMDNINVAAPPYKNAGAIACEYKSPGHFSVSLWVRKDNDLIKGLEVEPFFKRIIPGSDNQWTMGTTNARFNGVYAILPVHPNDSTAIANGMTPGGFYHTGDGVVRVIR